MKAGRLSGNLCSFLSLQNLTLDHTCLPESLYSFPSVITLSSGYSLMSHLFLNCGCFISKDKIEDDHKVLSMLPALSKFSVSVSYYDY